VFCEYEDKPTAKMCGMFGLAVGEGLEGRKGEVVGLLAGTGGNLLVLNVHNVEKISLSKQFKSESNISPP